MTDCRFNIVAIPIKDHKYSNIAFIIPNDTMMQPYRQAICDIINSFKNIPVHHERHAYQLYTQQLSYNTMQTLLTVVTDNHPLTIDHWHNIDPEETLLKAALNLTYITPTYGDIFVFGCRDKQYILNAHIEFIKNLNPSLDKNIYKIYFNDNGYNAFINDIAIDYDNISNYLRCNDNTITINGKKIDVNNCEYLRTNNDTLLIMDLNKNGTFSYAIPDANRISIIGFLNMIKNMTNDDFMNNFKLIGSILRELTVKNITNDPTNEYNYIYDLAITTYNKMISNIKMQSLVNVNVDTTESSKYTIINFLKNIASKVANISSANIKYDQKQTTNMIKNIKSIDKCVSDIKKWNEQYTNEYLNSFEKNEDYLLSYDQYKSILSCSSLIDELLCGNIIGIMIRVATPNLAKLGIIMDRVIITSIANNFISFDQICEAQDIYYTSHNRYDDGKTITVAISGNGLGTGNTILPLYINNIHWSLAKTQLNYCIGMTIAQNPFDYHIKQYEIYPMTLLTYFDAIISTRNNITEKDIIMLIQLIITNCIITKDIFKYRICNHTYDETISLYKNNKRSQSYFDNNGALMGQTMITNNNIISKQNKIINGYHKQLCIEEISRYMIGCEIKSILLENIYINLEQTLINVHINELLCFEIYNDETIKSIFKLDGCYFTEKPCSKFIVWRLVDSLNNSTTINHLNNVMKNTHGSISDEIIQYFKINLLALHEKYNKIYALPYNVFDDEIEANLLMKCIIVIQMIKKYKKYDYITNVDISVLSLEDLKKYFIDLTKIYLQELLTIKKSSPV